MEQSRRAFTDEFEAAAVGRLYKPTKTGHSLQPQSRLKDFAKADFWGNFKIDEIIRHECRRFAFEESQRCKSQPRRIMMTTPLPAYFESDRH